MTREDPNRILAILRDHEERIALLEGKKTKRSGQESDTWYKPGSTISKIVSLMDEGFFDEPHSVNEIISELRTRDYHFKPSDLTLPLRNIVRNGLLNRTKIYADGSPSGHWLFVRAPAT